MLQNVSQKPNRVRCKLLKHIHAELALIRAHADVQRAAHACSVFRELLGSQCRRALLEEIADEIADADAIPAFIQAASIYGNAHSSFRNDP